MKQSSGNKGFIWRTKIALVYFRWVKFLWFLLWRGRKIIQISVFIIWPADVWILSKFYWRLLWTWWILARKLVLTDHSSQNHEIPSGWPLGLGIMNVRLRVLERLPASATHPHSLHVASTSFSSFSSSNLDTEVTQTHILLFPLTFFCITYPCDQCMPAEEIPAIRTVNMRVLRKPHLSKQVLDSSPVRSDKWTHKSFFSYLLFEYCWESKSVKILVDTQCHLIETLSLSEFQPYTGI